MKGKPFLITVCKRKAISDYTIKMLSSPSKTAMVGATGNVGRPAVEELLKRKWSLRIITREKDKAKSMFRTFENADKLDYVECKDCSDLSGMRRALRGVEYLAINPPTVEKRAEITCRIIEAAKLENVKHVILISVPAGKTCDMLSRHVTSLIVIMVVRRHLRFAFLNLSISYSS
jgi:hypothetical protein